MVSTVNRWLEWFDPTVRSQVLYVYSAVAAFPPFERATGVRIPVDLL